MELDRAALRRLRAELRRARGFAVAARTLARGDVSLARLRRRLEQAGVPPGSSRDVLEALTEAGFASDERLARRRASDLAGRGYGDAAIRARLEADALGTAAVADALAELAPETERARALAARERDPVRAARTLARRGFAADVIEDVVGRLDADPCRGLP